MAAMHYIPQDEEKGFRLVFAAWEPEGYLNPEGAWQQARRGNLAELAAYDQELGHTDHKKNE